jgi:hypothetical protein
MDLDLNSSVSKLGRYVTQIFHFKDGQKRTFHKIDTKTIKQGQFTKLTQKNGNLLLINDNNVNMIEVISEKNINNNEQN